jgi:hypothetical protein
MLARKSFASLRRQTMASLIIQQGLIKSWDHKAAIIPQQH